MKNFFIILILMTLSFVGRAVETTPVPNAATATKISSVSLKVVKKIMSYTIDGVEISAEQLAKGGTTANGVSYLVSPKGITLSSATQDILLDTPPELGFTLNIPKAADAILSVNAASGLVDIQAGAKNIVPLILKMSDGAFVNINAGANVHLDLLKDGGYILAGTGNMEGRNADGQKYVFKPGTSIMVGGPTAEVRKSVATTVKITGNPGAELTLVIGEQTIKLPPGGKQNVILPNGSAIQIEQSALNGSFKWTVQKGNFVVNVDGITTWKVVGLGGQAASMTWDSAIKTVDLVNENSPRPVLVILPNRSFASVESGSTLQFSLLTSVQFATSALGKVSLYNNNSKETIALSEANFLFDKGSRRPKTSEPGLPLTLDWDNGQPLKARGIVKNELAAVNLKPGDPIKTMVSTAEKEAELDYSTAGFLIIRSVEGKYTLKIPAVNGLSLDLESGDNVSLKLDQKKGTFIVKADEWNNSDVSIHTANGFEPNLAPDRALNFNIKEDGSLEASDDGGFIVFAEKSLSSFLAEFNIPTAITKDVTFLNPNPRVIQPAVSVVR